LFLEAPALTIILGTWSLPGGHLDLDESFEDCAVREIREETGIVLQQEDVRFLTAINDHMDEDLKHYITIFMGCYLPGPTVTDGGVIMPEAQVSISIPLVPFCRS
jgi:ADP-ribose pyrophosphatase YjhB (NUDIX family)